jgi:hypothetical protein
MYKDECSPEEIKERIREIAFSAMVKSTSRQTIWRVKKNERPAHNLFPLMNGDLSPVFECVLHFAAISIHVQKKPVCA